MEDKTKGQTPSTIEELAAAVMAGETSKLIEENREVLIERTRLEVERIIKQSGSSNDQKLS